MMYTRVQSVESVACHLELAMLSFKFRITEHAPSSIVEYFSIFPAEFTRSAFSPGYMYNA